MKFRRPKVMIERPDIAPMADIVFLLLIFFMLSTSFVTEPGIKVQLPQASTAEMDPKQNLFLVIDRKGRIFVNKKEVKKESLGTLLEGEMAARKEKLLILKADRAVTHGLVVEVMDIARQHGVERLAIATEKRTTGRGR